jgi:hypothetical protein
MLFTFPVMSVSNEWAPEQSGPGDFPADTGRVRGQPGYGTDYWRDRIFNRRQFSCHRMSASAWNVPAPGSLQARQRNNCGRVSRTRGIAEPLLREIFARLFTAFGVHAS